MFVQQNRGGWGSNPPLPRGGAPDARWRITWHIFTWCPEHLITWSPVTWPGPGTGSAPAAATSTSPAGPSATAPSRAR